MVTNLPQDDASKAELIDDMYAVIKKYQKKDKTHG